MAEENRSPIEGKSGDASMEDILASIRRILNDEAEAKPEPALAPAQDEPFQLEEAMIVGAPAPAAEQEELPQVSDQLTHGAEPAPPLVEPTTASVAAESLGSLRRAVAERHLALGRGATIEDIVREELRPLLKSWLDAHLPELVERVVRAEVQRLTGQI